MTQEESKKLIKMMTALFPGMRQQNAEDAAAAYWHVLKGYGYKDVRDAVVVLAGKQRLIPTVSEIVELLPRNGAPQVQLDHWTKDALDRIMAIPGCPMLEKHGGEPLTVGEIVERYGTECGGCDQSGRCAYRDWEVA